jgi:hypothetical protein
MLPTVRKCNASSERVPGYQARLQGTPEELPEISKRRQDFSHVFDRGQAVIPLRPVTCPSREF